MRVKIDEETMLYALLGSSALTQNMDARELYSAEWNSIEKCTVRHIIVLIIHFHDWFTWHDI